MGAPQKQPPYLPTFDLPTYLPDLACLPACLPVCHGDVSSKASHLILPPRPAPQPAPKQRSTAYSCRRADSTSQTAAYDPDDTQRALLVIARSPAPIRLPLSSIFNCRPPPPDRPAALAQPQPSNGPGRHCCYHFQPFRPRCSKLTGPFPRPCLDTP